MYTIKSISEEGIFYLCRNWRKGNDMWVQEVQNNMLFQTIKGAKFSLKKLIEIMPEYLETDKFELVQVNSEGICSLGEVVAHATIDEWKTIVTIE